MPKTKVQDFIFSIIMVIIMVYCMTIYNMVIESGLHYSTFSNALLKMWKEAIIAFIAQKYIAGPLAKRFTFKIFKPGIDKPILINIIMVGLTVSIMAPIMTLFVVILHNGFIVEIPLLWLPKLIQNFAFALCIQIFYVGLLVHLIFRSIFRTQSIEQV